MSMNTILKDARALDLTINRTVVDCSVAIDPMKQGEAVEACLKTAQPELMRLQEIFGRVLLDPASLGASEKAVEDLAEIIEKCGCCIEQLEQIQNVVQSYMQLVREVEQAAGSGDVPTLLSLKGRAEQLYGTTPNRDIQMALAELRMNLSMTLGESSTASIPSASASEEPSLRPSIASSAARKNIIDLQDEECAVSLFQDKFKAINTQDFELVLGFYDQLTEFSKKEFFLSDATSPIILGLINRAKMSLEALCEAQSDLESEQMVLVQDQNEISAFSGGLNAIGGNSMDALSPLNTSFRSLSFENKEVVLNALAQVMIPKRPFARTLLGLPFNQWPGTIDQKKGALQVLLGTFTPMSKESKAAEMRSRFA